MVSSSASMAEVDGDRRIPPGDTDIIIGGATWTKDIRVTRNSAEDTLPQIAMDASDYAHIIWQRSGYWTKTVDHDGYALTKDIFITPHVVRGYGSPDRYPLGTQIAIDSASNIHLVWDDGWQNCYYQKLDPDGNVLTDVIQVGNQDNIASHVPSIAIDPVNDHVHIVHEDYQYQCEDIVYNKMDNDGRALINDLSVSNDVSSHCEHSTLTADQKGYIHVAFGSASGAWWRKVDDNGVARVLSVNLESVPTYMIPDMAITPDGDVHMVWTVDGEVRYTRMDTNGTFLDEDIVVTNNSVSPGPPRIAATHEENSVYIVWHDSRDGNAEIYYAKMEEGSNNKTPVNYRLTKNTAASLYPRVDVSPGDSVHIVWQDYRDGNSEIYYKFNFVYRLRLVPVNIPELAYMYLWHPNDTKKLGLYIENLGKLTDDYRVTLTYDVWAESDGWVIEVDETEFDRVLGGSKVYLNLTTTAPPTASAGDFVNVSITARSITDKNAHDTLAWRSYIIVEKAVTMVCAEPTKMIEPGGDVQFNLTITNIGDVPDNYRIEHTLIPEAGGWQAVQDIETVSLGVDESADLSVILSAPEDAKANDNGTVFVRVQSMTDASVWDGKKLLGMVDPEFHLMMEVLTPSKWVEPAGSVDFLITVRNVGNLQSKVNIYVSSTNPRPGWSVFISTETIQLAGGEEQVIILTVTAPADALAGSRQVIEVSTVTDDYWSRGSLEVSAVVNQVHGLWPSIDLQYVSVYGSEEGKHRVTITNEGNGNENVFLDSANVPAGWRITFEYEEEEVHDLMLMSKETRMIIVVVSTPSDAKAGKTPLMDVIIKDGAGNSYVISFSMRVYQRFAVDLSAPVHQGVGAPNGVATYLLTVHNEGNGEDVFVLEHGDLPGTNWDASFHEVDGTPVSSVTLAGGEERTIEMRVNIPEDADLTEPVDIYVKAISTSAEMDEVKLILNVRLPDLQIQSVEYDPTTTTDQIPTHITIKIANKGSSPAENVNVVMLVDDVELDREVVRTLNEDSFATVTFQWTPSPGKHTLTYQVSTSVMEADYDNNQLDHVRTVDDVSTADTGFMILAVFLVVACVVVALLLRRKVYPE